MGEDILEKMAYIMIIIVCFAILLTILVYFISILMKKRANLKYCSKHAKEKEEICKNPECVMCLQLQHEMKISEYKRENHQLAQMDTNELNEKKPANNDLNSQSPNLSDVPTDGIIYHLINKLKKTFQIESATEMNGSSDCARKQSCITLTGSSLVTENENLANFKVKKKMSKSLAKRSLRKNSSLKGTNLVSSSTHSVKFKDTENSHEFSSDDSLSHTSSRVKTSGYSSAKSSIDYSKKNSISSYSNSRKSSSISSTYNEPAVVGYYRRKRLSDASSVYTNNTSISDLSNRKFSINHPNSLKDSNLRLVALEQQPSIAPSLPSSKKSSICSFGTSSSKISSTGGDRRFSIMAPLNVSDKFWVPPEIERHVRLEKQRASLPNTDLVSGFNEKLYELKSEANGLDEIEENLTADLDFESKADSMNQNNSRRESSTSSGAASRNPAAIASGRRRASMFDPIDPTELQKTLYLKLNQEQNSNEKEEQAIDSIGTFEFGIQYLSDSQKLIVDLLRVFDLQFKDTNPNSDLYCKCTLMPDKSSFQTKLIKRNSNPVFEEQFEFDCLDSSKLDSRYLEISMNEVDKVTREDCLGMCGLKLNYQNIESKKIFLKEIKPFVRPSEENYIGDIMFSLAYLPAAERLTIVVIKARNLQGLGPDKKILPGKCFGELIKILIKILFTDPFVKVSILTKDGKKLKKKKTSSQKGTMCPVYNEEIVFTHLKKEQLNDITIQFLIYHDSLTNRELLGSFSISSSSRGNEYAQWKDMLDSKKSIAWWHSLTALNSNVDSDHNSSQNFSINNRKNSKSINLFNFKPKPISVSYKQAQALGEHP
ncbi:synaptotagmin-5 isoform X1 [Brachionus plicatilis]|uniref:Synaptotagmin-5 isoform X1 n=1 Tax=Brachionus plicatilis TaxID=10195 RepID=A0A3M7P9Q8_BRAPC|nr:synaptotagmin-5 isoform X1 [Brachionus plicatilis]